MTKQQQRVLDYVKRRGFINPLQSWRQCGVYRLSAVILELKKQGYRFKTHRVPVKNSFGEKCIFGNYELLGDGTNEGI